MKFKVIDRNGKKYSVEEVKKVSDSHPRYRKSIMKDEEPKDDLAFTKKEVESLKELAKVAKELIGLFETEKDKKDEKDDDKKEDFKAKKDGDVDLDFDLIDDKDEEVIDVEDSCNDEDIDDIMIHDSKKSFGAIEKSKVTDSINNSNEDDIASVWAQRYSKRD